MKAQNYQIKRDNLIIYGFLVCLVLPIFGMLLDGSGFDGMDGGLFTVSMFGFFPFLFPLLSLIIITRICGWDMNDKTINYELLSGHSRVQVYFGRVFCGILWTMLGGIFVTLLPILFVTVFKGWGNSLDFGDAAARYVVMLCPNFRWACELILLTFLVRNSHVAAVLGFVLFETGGILSLVLQEMTDIAMDVQFTTSNLLELSDVSNFRDMLIGENVVSVYEAVLEPKLMTDSVVISLAVGIICLLFGYAVFRRRDMS